jgi:hypothetical protein
VVQASISWDGGQHGAALELHRELATLDCSSGEGRAGMPCEDSGERILDGFLYPNRVVRWKCVYIPKNKRNRLTHRQCSGRETCLSHQWRRRAGSGRIRGASPQWDLQTMRTCIYEDTHSPIGRHVPLASKEAQLSLLELASKRKEPDVVRECRSVIRILSMWQSSATTPGQRRTHKQGW